MLAKSGYDHSKKAQEIELREMTADELKARPSHAKVIDRSGNWRTVKITSVKTWKTRPNDVTVGWKYGLYEYGYTEYKNGEWARGPQLVTEVAS